jgi:hypothetical protein
MCYDKITVARVALGISSAEEKAQMRAHAATCIECQAKITKLAIAAQAVAGPFCMSKEDLLRSAETTSLSDEEDDHLRGCSRCAKIGFTIYHLPSDESGPIASL